MGIFVHVHDHAEGLTYGEVGNVLAGIGILARSKMARDSMFEYWDEDSGENPITYGFLSE